MRAANAEGGTPTLICLHGLSASSRWWSRVVPRLERSGPVVLLDIPRALAPEEVPSWLIGVIEEHGAGVDLAGHSLGALVSVRVAAQRQELVRRLVLIAPPGIRSRRSSLEYAWPLVRSVARSRPGFLVRLTSDALRAGPRNLVRGGRHVARTDIGAELASVTAPTLLLWGEHDRLVPSRDAAQWRESLPDARLVVLANARHVPMLEAPEELAEAIARFREERLDEPGDGPGI
jgi:pimeloyl-ACP methyl ester carboxylesterase